VSYDLWAPGGEKLCPLVDWRYGLNSLWASEESQSPEGHRPAWPQRGFASARRQWSDTSASQVGVPAATRAKLAKAGSARKWAPAPSPLTGRGVRVRLQGAAPCACPRATHVRGAGPAAGKASVGAVAQVACVVRSSSVRHRGLLQQVSRLLCPLRALLFAAMALTDAMHIYLYILLCTPSVCVLSYLPNLCSCISISLTGTDISLLFTLVTDPWINNQRTTNQQCNRVKRMNSTS